MYSFRSTNTIWSIPLYTQYCIQTNATDNTENNNHIAKMFHTGKCDKLKEWTYFWVKNLFCISSVGNFMTWSILQYHLTVSHKIYTSIFVPKNYNLKDFKLYCIYIWYFFIQCSTFFLYLYVIQRFAEDLHQCLMNVMRLLSGTLKLIEKYI